MMGRTDEKQVPVGLDKTGRDLITKNQEKIMNAYTAAFARPYSKDTGGDYPRDVMAQDGLTKREYFAAAALQGLLASGQYDGTIHDFHRAVHDALTCANQILTAMNPPTTCINEEGATDES